MSLLVRDPEAHRSKAMLFLTIATPVGFNIAYFHLAAKFRYPEILREKPQEILSLFGQVQNEIRGSWLLITLAAVAFIFVSVWIAEQVVETKNRSHAILAGSIAGVVQAIGLSRWLFAVPAVQALSVNNTTATSAETSFVVIHAAFGIGVGEFLGYLLTAVWTLFVSKSIWGNGGRAVGIVGTLCGVTILAGCLETLGVEALGPVVAIGYLIWSLWLIALGVMMPKGKWLATR